MSTPQEIAEAASQPGTFNFLDRLRGRNYPAEVIEVYLDEAKGYALKKLEAKASGTVNDAALKKVEKEIEDLRAELRADAYFIHLRAVPSEAYDKLVDEANETFPPVYTEVSSPLTGQVTKTQEPSEERAALFTALKWVAFVEKVVDSSGAEATLNTADEAALWRLNLPIEAVLKVDMTLNELRMAVEWMDAIQDESFLATP